MSFINLKKFLSSPNLASVVLLFCFVFVVGFFVVFVWFGDRVSLCGLSHPRTCSVDQAGLELRDSPASTS